MSMRFEPDPFATSDIWTRIDDPELDENLIDGPGALGGRVH